MAADSQRNTPHQPVMDDRREMGARYRAIDSAEAGPATEGTVRFSDQPK
jgi:hypothetical protein